MMESDRNDRCRISAVRRADTACRVGYDSRQIKRNATTEGLLQRTRARNA